ncbi:interferon-induced 35 kDa protein homolog [Anguilla anguilla]|uniref:interferon-induced 35 kDa protein homolog n=1 Tax=Anguilla anguilla TaxID=7936 RepID=UPI0015AE9FC7|nr:interferon-induced 35 kDa protein homolog [Anguilla anguilla]XP_035260802.1 interferon-induced 35 kDa protein homolog [Anguilla anguilla]
MSDEKFSVVTTNGDVSTVTSLDEVMQEIKKQKESYTKLLEDHRELSKDVDSNVDLTKQFQKQIATLTGKLAEEKKEQARSLEPHKGGRMRTLQDEESRLKAEIQKLDEDLVSLDRLTHQLKQRTQVSTAMPEKRVVFTGSVSVGREASAGAQAGTSSIDMKVRIMYPMEGGTALVTFEDEKVAQNIVRMEHHEIHVGDCVLRLKAKPMHFLMPSHIEMDTHVCPRRILVSDLPKVDDENRLMDRLEIHFQKKRNGGGEVESVDMLHDSGNVVITFMEDNVAKGLTDTKYHDLDNKYKLRVTPFVNGEITDLQTRMSVSQRTVLLTGIPDIMEQENMQDSLEIHFQKGGNGGGEVDAFVYNPMGHRKLAIFMEDSPK